jgi:hypothetical protein
MRWSGQTATPRSRDSRPYSVTRSASSAFHKPTRSAAGLIVMPSGTVEKEQECLFET